MTLRATVSSKLRWVHERTPAIKDDMAVVQNVVAVIAVGAAAIWFLGQGLGRPALQLEHVVTQRPVEADPSKTLVWIELKATNIGKIPVHLTRDCMALMLLDEENPAGKVIDSSSTGPSVDLERRCPKSGPYPSVPEARDDDHSNVLLSYVPLNDLWLAPGESDRAISVGYLAPQQTHALKVRSKYEVPKYWPSWHPWAWVLEDPIFIEVTKR
jgi:hypothetical protein